MPTHAQSYSRNLEEALANRRAAFRHDLPAPLRHGVHEGSVRNLSTRGLYFVTSSLPRVGSVIELEIGLPHASPSGSLDCRVTARVLRVNPVPGGTGVAAEIEGWKMPEVDPDA
jgi:hypothetical protein